MLIVAPMPPAGVPARLVLKTSMPEMASDARFAKSNAREFEAEVSPMLDAGICRPLSSTMLKSGPTPRTVTREPSPIERSIDTPEMRCSDSARLVSGNLPISSAEMPSTTPWPLRLTFMADVRLPRMPRTSMVSRSPASDAGAFCSEGGSVSSVCCAVCAAADCASANSSAVVSSRFLGMASSCFIDHPSPGSARACFRSCVFFCRACRR